MCCHWLLTGGSCQSGGSRRSLQPLSELWEGGKKKKEECYLHEKINEGKEEGRDEGQGGRDEGKGGRSPTLVILQQLVHSDVPHLL